MENILNELNANSDNCTVIKTESYMEAENKIIDLPASIEKIESFAFSYCDYLTKVNYSNYVTEIDENAFSYCYYLDNIIIPKNLKSFDHCICYECQNLKNIIWNADIRPTKEMITTMFVNCPFLHTINYKDEIIYVATLTHEIREIELTKKQKGKYKLMAAMKEIKNFIGSFLSSTMLIGLSILFIYLEFDEEFILGFGILSLLSYYNCFHNLILAIKKIKEKNKFYIVKPSVRLPYLLNPNSTAHCTFTFRSPGYEYDNEVKCSQKFVEELNGNYDILCDSSNNGYAFIAKDFKELLEN